MVKSNVYQYRRWKTLIYWKYITDSEIESPLHLVRSEITADIYNLYCRGLKECMTISSKVRL